MNCSDNSKSDYMGNKSILLRFILITVFSSGFLLGSANNTAPLPATTLMGRMFYKGNNERAQWIFNYRFQKKA